MINKNNHNNNNTNNNDTENNSLKEEKQLPTPPEPSLHPIAFPSSHRSSRLPTRLGGLRLLDGAAQGLHGLEAELLHRLATRCARVAARPELRVARGVRGASVAWRAHRGAEEGPTR